MQQLKALGFKTAAMALSDNSVSIDDPDLMAEEKLAVIYAGGARRISINPQTMNDKTLEIIGAREALWSEYANRRAI